MLKGFVIGFFCFLVFLLLHIVIFHRYKVKKRFKMLLRIFYSLLPLYIFLYILIPNDVLIIMPVDPRVTPGVVIGISKFFNFTLGILIYLFFFFGYCQFYFIIDRSISVRIMIELESLKDKKLDLAEIKKRYSPDYVFSGRLKQMIDSKYITEDSGFYKNLSLGRFMARIFGFLKNYLNLGPGG